MTTQHRSLNCLGPTLILRAWFAKLGAFRDEVRNSFNYGVNYSQLIVY